MRLSSALSALALSLSLLPAPVHADPSEVDPFLWLENVEGARALAWVREQNGHTLESLKADPAYADALAAAQSILAAKDRIPFGNLAAGYVYNFWQDDAHDRGVWRRTSLAQYQTDAPQWETLIDLDDLSLRQNEKWMWKGAQCLAPAYRRCLVNLSRGGRDAIVVREFDIPTRSFVRDGFEIAEGKTDVAWVDMNTIMIGTNWGRGTLTNSGYARIVKVLSRGQFILDARTIFEGRQTDVAVKAIVEFDAAGKPERFIVRGMDFFNSEFFHVDANWRAVRVPVPAFAEFKGLHKRQLLFALMKDWRTAGRIFLQGSLISISLDRFLETGGALPEIKSLFTPDAKTAIDTVAPARDAVYISVLENVKGRIHEIAFDGANWSWRRVALPGDGAVAVASASPVDREVLLKYYELSESRPALCHVLRRRAAAHQGNARAFRRLRIRGPPIRGRLVGRHENPLLRRSTGRHAGERQDADAALRLRRLSNSGDPLVLGDRGQALARERRRLRRRQRPRRRRVRPALARRGHGREPATKFRRSLGRRAQHDRARLHLAAPPGLDRRLARRSPRHGCFRAEPGTLQRRLGPSAR